MKNHDQKILQNAIMMNSLYIWSHQTFLVSNGYFINTSMQWIWQWLMTLQQLAEKYQRNCQVTTTKGIFRRRIFEVFKFFDVFSNQWGSLIHWGWIFCEHSKVGSHCLYQYKFAFHLVLSKTPNESQKSIIFWSNFVICNYFQYHNWTYK